MGRLGRLFALPYFPVLISPWILFGPTLLFGKALFWGTPSLQFIPWWDLAWETVRSGHMPLWNPLVGMGAPLLANYQSGVFYPPNWVYFLLDSLGGVPAMAWGQALMVAVHLTFAGIGMIFLVRKLGLDPLPQAIGGLAFSLSGYLVARAGFLSITSAVTWLPWVLLLGIRLIQTRRPIVDMLLLALVYGLQLLAGHAQTAVYGTFMLIFWAAFWIWRGVKKDSGNRLRPILIGGGRLGIALLLGILLASIQLLPTLEYLTQSQRASAVGFEFAMTYSFWPWRFLTLLAPDLFGSPAHGDYWGYAAFWEDAIYVGLLPLLLAMRAILRAIRPSASQGDDRPSLGYSKITRADLQALTFGLLAWMVLSFLLALGKNTPIFPWLYRNVPGFDMFQAPTRVTIWAVMCLSLLAALGVSGWKRPEGRGLYWTRLGTAGAFAIVIAAFLGWGLLDTERQSLFLAVAKAGFWAICIGVLALTAPTPGTSPSRITRWSWGVALLVGLDLLVAGWGLNPSVDLDFYRSPSPTALQVQSLADGGRLYLASEDEYDLKFDRFFLFSSYDPGEAWINLRAALLPNIQMLDGIWHTSNFDPILPARYSHWMEALEQVELPIRERLLNLSGVSVVELPDPREASGVRFESRGTPARIRWFSCARVVPDGGTALELLESSELEPDRFVVLELPGQNDDELCGVENAQITLKGETSQRLDLAVSASSDGWLYLADVWYPGWHASVDGEDVPVVRANYLFKAIPIPAGDHQVTVVYRSLVILVGAILSLAGWLGLLVISLLVVRRARLSSR